MHRSPVTTSPIAAHIVLIKRPGVIIAHQLRVNGGGPGNSSYFSSKKHGGEEKARKAAVRAARKLGTLAFNKRGGSPVGRVTKRIKTGASGIRFELSDGAVECVLSVRATWSDNHGRDRSTSYSTAIHGLEGALDKAIEKRASCGAPRPDKLQLRTALRKTYRAGLD